MRLFDDPLHYPLGHSLPEEGSRCRPEKEKIAPPVSVQGPDEAKVEAVILRQLAAHRASLGKQGGYSIGTRIAWHFRFLRFSVFSNHGEICVWCSLRDVLTKGVIRVIPILL